MPDAPSDAGPAGQRLRAGLLVAAVVAALTLAAAVQWRLGGAAAGALGLAGAILAGAALGLALRRGAAGPAQGERPAALEAPAASEAAEDDALRRNEARLRAAVDSLPDAIFCLNESGLIETANPAALRLFGYAPAELEGRDLGVLTAGGDAIAELATGGPTQRECRRKDGSVFPAELAVAGVEAGPRRSFVARLHDLSERKAAEEGLRHAQRMEAVGQLTGGVAHDFNNFLTVVLAYSGLLSDALEGRDERLRKMAETIRGAARNAADLTQQLLAFARRQSLEPAEVDVSELLKTMQRLLRPALGERIELSLRLPSEPARVFVDRAQLEAALTNLAVNGREAMPQGGRLTMEAALTTDAAGRRCVALTVRDEGRGMSAEVRERAFEPFFTTKEIGKGSGLGLSMVYGFVKQSGGDVRIESEPGRGASVTLVLPALPVRPGDSQRFADAEADAPAAGGETILVVEDEPMVREFVVAQLERLGYAVVEAVDGPSALAAIERAGRLDLVFTDVVMPGGMTGFALAEAARRMRPGLRFLFTSGYSDEEVAERPRGAGVDLLAKPYELNELTMRIRAALAQARP